jgi:hypothetical protein
MIRPRLLLLVACASLATGAAFKVRRRPRPQRPSRRSSNPCRNSPPPGLSGDVELDAGAIKRRDGAWRSACRQRAPGEGDAAARPAVFSIPDGSGNVYIRRDSLDTGLKVPLWLLLEF